MALQQIKERGALPMIDRGDIDEHSTVAAISGLHCRALVMVSSSIRLTTLIAKFKEAGGTVREIDVWASHRDYLSALVICIIVYAVTYALLIITVITPLPTKRDKNARELKLANAAITDMQMHVSMVLLRSCKIHEGVS